MIFPGIFTPADLSAESVRISEYLRERTPFADWDAFSRNALALAMYPRDPVQIDGRWTEQGRAALNLLRHMIRKGHFLTAPAVVREASASLTAEEAERLAPYAENLRMDLLRSSPPWLLDGLV